MTGLLILILIIIYFTIIIQRIKKLKKQMSFENKFRKNESEFVILNLNEIDFDIVYN
tara:strand:+ start:3865 stop:4035 length:171 start_codon:yes stop_codon:yes gene_type:complete